MRILTHGYCVDNTGVVFVKLIKVLGNSYKKQAEVGDKVAVVIAAINVKAKNMQDERKRRKLRSGSVHWAIVVQTKIRFKRWNRSYMRFTKNAVVLVDKNNTPLGKRIKAAIPIELANRYPQFGLIAKRIV